MTTSTPAKSLHRVVAPALLIALGLGAASPAMAKGADRSGHYETRYDTASRGQAKHERRAAFRHAGIRGDIVELRRDIARSEARRAISPREARGLRRDLQRLEARYGRLVRHGLDRSEYRQLEWQVDALRLALRAERRDADRRRG